MKRQSLFKPILVAALTVSSAVPSLFLSASSAKADDYNDSIRARNEYCTRYPNVWICNQNNSDWRNQNNSDWRNQNNSDWRNQHDRDWRNQNNDDWRNRNGNSDWRRDSRREDLRLSSGAYISTRAYRQGRIVLRRGEQYSYQLITDRDLMSDRGSGVVIPRGSIIEGVLVPYRNGYRFEARTVSLSNGTRQNISAVSDVIASENQYSRGGGSVLSPAASVILGTLLGRRIDSNSDSQWSDIFNRDSRARRDLVVVYPNRDLDLKLKRDFVVSSRY